MAKNKWSIPFDQLAKKVELDLETVIRKSMFDIMTKIVDRTPIDTGRLASNWRFSKGKINTTTTQAINTSESYAQAHGALKTTLGSMIYFTNSLPYAYPIEFEGHSSTKAPAGMVRVSVREFSDAVRRAIK